MNNSVDKIPGFGGVIGTESFDTQTAISGTEMIFDSNNLKLFVSGNSSCGLQKFHVSDNQFIWTGGLSLGMDFQLNEFDYYKADHKFIYVTFIDSGLQIYTDHYSKMPLLYLYENETLYFATSMELLLQVAGRQSTKFNVEGLLFYYNFGFTSFNHTLINGVKSLSGGQVLKFNNGKINIETYFNVFDVTNYIASSKPLESHVNSIDTYLLQSTRNVLESNQNIGIALSGGVDSGYLAQKINECGKSFNAYTIGFKDDYNEFERVDYLSKKLNFTTKKIILKPEDIITNYLEVSKHSSFPVGFNNSILNFIYKEASQDGVDIMFDGDGADRLFLGMNKYLQLQKILKLYTSIKSVNGHKIFASILKLVLHPTASKLRFYFLKFNNDFPFYGERKLSDSSVYDIHFEKLLNDLALPKELKKLSDSIDKWLFFSIFSVYYTPTFFFHTPYELQLKHNIVSNPQFWSDDLVTLALQIPTDQKLRGNTTKVVLREAAKIKIDDGYWNLSKIGLQNSYSYIKRSKQGKVFVADYISVVKKSEEYKLLDETMPYKIVDAERLIPYIIWKEYNK